MFLSQEGLLTKKVLNVRAHYIALNKQQGISSKIEKRNTLASQGVNDSFLYSI